MAFRLGPEASRCGLRDIDRVHRYYNSELLNHVSKNWDVLAGRNKTDYNLFEKKKKLSVYFRRRTSQFLTRDLIMLNYTLSTSHSPRQLAWNLS